MDKHNYPTAATAQELLTHQLAVMTAFQNGEPIEWRFGDQWVPLSVPAWSWGTCDYRVAPPKVAEGHNPYKVSIKSLEGQRLLSDAELLNIQKAFVSEDCPEELADAIEFSCGSRWVHGHYEEHWVGVLPDSDWESIYSYRTTLSPEELQDHLETALENEELTADQLLQFAEDHVTDISSAINETLVTTCDGVYAGNSITDALSLAFNQYQE